MKFQYYTEPLRELMSEDDLKLDHIPDAKECREIKAKMNAEKFWPNVWHVNERGNVDLLIISRTGASILQSWV